MAQQKTQLAKADPRAMGMKAIMDSPAFQQSLTAALPRHLTPDKMVRVVLSAFQTTPRLLECKPETVLLSLMRAAMMGLEPDGGTIGHGYLVPYWSGKRRCYECQFIPGYRGLVKLARNSGEVADVWAEVVYEHDAFGYSLGLEPKLDHKRNDEVDDVGAIKYAYAVARFRDGATKFVVMPWREIKAIRDASPSSHNKQGELCGPWKDHAAEQCKKTAVRRLCKLLPLSADVEAKIASEHAAIDFATAMAGKGMLALPSPPDQDENAPDDAAELYGVAFAQLSECENDKAVAAAVKELKAASDDPDYADAVDQMAADRREAFKQAEESEVKK